MQPLTSTPEIEAGPGYRGLILALAALLFLQIAAFAVWQRWFRNELPPSAGLSESAVARMQQDLRERRYDEAVQTGLSALKNLPSDDLVLQQIAVVYLRRAQLEGDQERWQRKPRIMPRERWRWIPAIRSISTTPLAFLKSQGISPQLDGANTMPAPPRFLSNASRY